MKQTVMLDRRERALVVALIIDGSIPKAARALGLSERHTRRLLRELERRMPVGNTYALVAWALLTGEINLQDLVDIGAPRPAISGDV